jgi:hypothetical protein
MMMERGKPVSGRCVHSYPITVVLLGEERRLTFLSMDNGICLAWAVGALQQLRQEGRTKVVGYLEAVLEEVVFEAIATVLQLGFRGCSLHAVAHTDARE